MRQARAAAVHQAGALLRDLGHDVVRDPDYPASTCQCYLPFFRGISDDADAQAHPDPPRSVRRVWGRSSPTGGWQLRSRRGSRISRSSRCRRSCDARRRDRPVPHRRLPTPGVQFRRCCWWCSGFRTFKSWNPDRPARGRGAVGLRRRPAHVGSTRRPGRMTRRRCWHWPAQSNLPDPGPIGGRRCHDIAVARSFFTFLPGRRVCGSVNVDW